MTAVELLLRLRGAEPAALCSAIVLHTARRASFPMRSPGEQIRDVGEMRCGLRVRSSVDVSINREVVVAPSSAQNARAGSAGASRRGSRDAKPSAPTSLIFGLNFTLSIAVEHPIPPRQRQPATPSQWAPTDLPTYVRSRPRIRCRRQANWTDKIRTAPADALQHSQQQGPHHQDSRWRVAILAPQEARKCSQVR